MKILISTTLICLFISCINKKPDPTSNNISQDTSSNNITNQTKPTHPIKSEINDFKYSKELLFKKWMHDLNDNNYAFEFTDKSFLINYDRVISVPYIINHDSIEIFEYHDSETSKGKIIKLTSDSLVIKWITEDVNRYTVFQQQP